jgi:hypothetical protein
MTCSRSTGHVFPAHSQSGERCTCGAYERNDSERGIRRASPLAADAEREHARGMRDFMVAVVLGLGGCAVQADVPAADDDPIEPADPPTLSGYASADGLAWVPFEASPGWLDIGGLGGPCEPLDLDGDWWVGRCAWGEQLETTTVHYQADLRLPDLGDGAIRWTARTADSAGVTKELEARVCGESRWCDSQGRCWC